MSAHHQNGTEWYGGIVQEQLPFICRGGLVLGFVRQESCLSLLLIGLIQKQGCSFGENMERGGGVANCTAPPPIHIYSYWG